MGVGGTVRWLVGFTSFGLAATPLPRLLCSDGTSPRYGCESSNLGFFHALKNDSQVPPASRTLSVDRSGLIKSTGCPRLLSRIRFPFVGAITSRAESDARERANRPKERCTKVARTLYLSPYARRSPMKYHRRYGRGVHPSPRQMGALLVDRSDSCQRCCNSHFYGTPPPPTV